MDSFYDVFPIQSMAKPVKSDINKGRIAMREFVGAFKRF